MSLHGTYDVRAHLAGDGYVFCSLVDDDGETYFPDDIERIETAMGQAELDQWGDRCEMETALLTEAERSERDEDAPVVGTATYEDGELASTDFDLSPAVGKVRDEPIPVGG